ncbi:unnamed protein product [Musa acuminata subsp. burmannicoides]
MSSLVLPSVGLKDHVSLPLRLHGEGQEEGKEVEAARKRNGFCLEGRVEAEESSESSSIGAASSSSEKDEKDEEEEAVESKRKDGAFGSLDPLEDSLPIKRGLSNFFSGKSKSFASLSDAAMASAGELVKPENPFNKRRRLLMASKMRRASYSSLVRPPLPPLLPSAHTVEEEADDDDDDDDDKEQQQEDDDTNKNKRHGTDITNTNKNKNKKQGAAFRSPRSFSLSDLQQL